MNQTEINQVISDLLVKDPGKYLTLPTLRHNSEEIETLITLFQEARNPTRADYLIIDLLEKTLAFRYATDRDVLPYKKVNNLTLIFDDLAQCFLLTEVECGSEDNKKEAETLTAALSYCQLSLSYRIKDWQLSPEQLTAWNDSILKNYADHRC